MTPQEAQALIFEPGFSTTDEDYGCVWCGVGMDAVKLNWKTWNGSVDDKEVNWGGEPASA